MNVIKFLSNGRSAASLVSKFSNALNPTTPATFLVQSRGVRLLKNRVFPRPPMNELRKRGIEWQEPAKTLFYDPEALGDLEGYNPPDKTRPTKNMALAIDEYDEAPPLVQRLLSLEFASPGQTLQLAKYDARRRVQRHQHDVGSRAAQVANLTARIRMLQSPQHKYRINKYNLRSELRKAVAKRRNILTKLRESDYKYFEYVLEKLNLSFREKPEQCNKVTEHDAVRELVRMRCENIRKRRIDAYKAKLDASRQAFEKEKYETLVRARAVQEKHGVKVTCDPEKGIIKIPEPKELSHYEKHLKPHFDL